MKPDSCSKSNGESFDTHHDNVELVGQKLRSFLHFDPGFGRDTRANLKLKAAYSRRHLIAFRINHGATSSSLGEDHTRTPKGLIDN